MFLVTGEREDLWHSGYSRIKPYLQLLNNLYLLYCNAPIQSIPMRKDQNERVSSMAELDEILHVQSHFSPHCLLIILINLVRALAILCKLDFR